MILEKKKALQSQKTKRGNVLFLILIAVALFGALSYAVTSSMRTGSSTTEKEQAKLDQAVMDSYMASINVGKMRLEMAGCSPINYTAPADQGAGDKSCHIFHPDGGEVVWQDLFRTCDLDDNLPCLEDLAIGESAGGVTFIGTPFGRRVYTTASDQGQAVWGGYGIFVGSNNDNDGLANTDNLIARADSYPAAETCRALGVEWYLPSRMELNMMYSNRTLIGGFNTSGVYYWTSTESSSANAKALRFSDGMQYVTAKSKSFYIRCVRR